MINFLFVIQPAQPVMRHPFFGRPFCQVDVLEIILRCFIVIIQVVITFGNQENSFYPLFLFQVRQRLLQCFYSLVVFLLEIVGFTECGTNPPGNGFIGIAVSE